MSRGIGGSPSSWHNPLRIRRAFGEEKRSQRIYERFKCDLAAIVWILDAKTRIGQGRLIDISMGGALIECRFRLEKNIQYIFQISGSPAPVTISGKIARILRQGSAKPDQYGITFGLSAKQRGTLNGIIDHLRTQAAKSGSIEDAKVKWYWGV